MKSLTLVATVAILIVGLILAADNQVSAAGVSQGATVYTVRLGDSLSSIASRYGTSYLAIKAANGLGGDTIYPGQTLVIPVNGAAGSVVGYSPQGLVAPSWSGSTSGDCSSGYRVQRGDTLSAISARCGVSLTSLLSANGLSSSKIYAGQWLSVPASVSSGVARTSPSRSYLPVSTGSNVAAPRSPTPTPTVMPAFPTWRYSH